MIRCRARCLRALVLLPALLAPLLVGPVPAAATGPDRPGPVRSATVAPPPLAPLSLTQLPPALLPLTQLPLDREGAWQHSTGDGVIVAVVDSGVDADHPALAGRVLPGADFVDGSTDGRVDPVGHGTAVASLVAGQVGTGTEGLAPDATVLPVRVLDERNRYREATTVAAGVEWAVDQGADVINLSLGGERESLSLAGAISYAMANDVVVIACTGNSKDGSDSAIWYPAREPGVVAVAGMMAGDGAAQHWPRSLTGREAVLAAPAVLTAAAPGGGERQVQGTSFAAALVSGTAALVRARWPEAPAGAVVHRLVATATDIGEPGRDEWFGFGAVDPVAALTVELAATPANPLDTKARHGHGALGPAPQAGVGGQAAVEPTTDAGAGAAGPPADAALTSASGWFGVTVAAAGAVLAVVSAARLAGWPVRRSRRCRSVPYAVPPPPPPAPPPPR